MIPTRRTLLALLLLSATSTPAPASAAVTSGTCTTRSTAYSNLPSGSGEDWSNVYERNVQKSPASTVSVTSTWLCQPFNGNPEGDGLAFTSTLRHWNAPSGPGASTLVNRGCGTLHVFTPSFDIERFYSPFAVGTTTDHSIVCDWQLHESTLPFGRTYFLEVSEFLTYDWETSTSGANYTFNIRLDVHSEVSQPSPAFFDVPVCFRTTPQLACGFLPLDP